MKTKNIKHTRIERGRVARELIGLFKDAEEILEPLFSQRAKTLIEAISGNKKSRYLKNYLNSRIKILVEDGFIVRKQGAYTLTTKGQESLAKIISKKPKKPKRWDRKWRVVMFDVYESQKAIRDRFRKELKEYGFIQMQRSVWVYPYECEDFITLIKVDNKFGKNVRYGVLESLEGDAGLCRHFGL